MRVPGKSVVLRRELLNGWTPRLVVASCLLFWIGLLLVAGTAWAYVVDEAKVQSRKLLSPDGPVLVVTCFIPLGNGPSVSPLVTAALVDGDGKRLRRKTSYGGRHYSFEMFTKIGRQAALAATASPVPVKKVESTPRAYQFVFFDVPDAMERVKVSVKGKPAVKSKQVIAVKSKQKPVAEPEQVPGNIGRKATKKRTGVSPKPGQSKGLDSSSLKVAPPVSGVDLVGGSGQVVFASRPVIQSFLNEEVVRLLKTPRMTSDDNVPLPEEIEIARHSAEYARTVLAPVNIMPIWEYAHVGMSLDTVSRTLPALIAGDGQQGKLSVVDCASGICEYALEGVPGTAEYRLYFMNDILRSMVIVFASNTAQERRDLLGRLKTLYSGRIWSRGKRSALSDNINNIEYTTVYENMNIETMGSTLRVFESN